MNFRGIQLLDLLFDNIKKGLPNADIILIFKDLFEIKGNLSYHETVIPLQISLFKLVAFSKSQNERNFRYFLINSLQEL